MNMLLPSSQASIAPRHNSSHKAQPAVLKSLHGAVFLALISVFLWAAPASAAPNNQTVSVNPLIGTARGPGGGINLFPGATTPFGMVQLSPDTEDHGYGYHYGDTAIQGFSMTHMSGPGCANEGDVFFTATTGPITTRIQDFASPYSHSMETATPGYYQVRLLQWDIDARLSATDRTGIAQFTFPAGQPANILLPLSRTLNYTTAASVHIVGNNKLEGYVQDRVFCGRKATYKVYFVMTFSRPFSSFGTWTGTHYGGPGAIAANSRSLSKPATTSGPAPTPPGPPSPTPKPSPPKSPSRTSISPALKTT